MRPRSRSSASARWAPRWPSNLAKAGFAVTVWNRTPGRAAELAAHGVATAADRGGSRGRCGRRRGLRLGHAGRRGRALRPRRAWSRVPARGRSSSTARRSRRRARADFAARLRERGLAMVDAPVSGGSEGAQKATLTIFVGGDAAGRRACPPGPVGDGQDHHARRTHRCRSGGQGGQPGDPRRRRTSGSPRGSSSRSGPASTSSRWSRRSAAARPRAGSSRTGAAGCSTTTIRSGSRSPSTARTSGSPSTSPPELGAVLPSQRAGAQLESGLIAKGHGDDDMSALARAVRGLSGLDD